MNNEYAVGSRCVSAAFVSAYLLLDLSAIASGNQIVFLHNECAVRSRHVSAASAAASAAALV